MGLTRLSLRRPLTMLMIIVALLIMGWQGYNRLLLDRFPAVDFPFVTVTVIFPGASPEDVEDLVLKPLEDAISTISGIDELNATAQEGIGTIVVAFVEGTDGNAAAIDVERQVSSARGKLPDDAEVPVVGKFDFNSIPVVILSLNGPQNQETLFDLADNEIKTRLQTVEGVASVSVAGGREREVQVLVDQARLAGFGLSLNDLQQKLQSYNLSFPGGSIEEGRAKVPVRAVGEFTNLTQIENLVIKDNNGGGGGPGGPGGGSTTLTGNGKIYLRDVAQVQMGQKDPDSYLRYNGRDAVSVAVIKSSDANTVEVVDNVFKVVKEVNQDLPPGAQLNIVLDNANFIRESVAAVLEDLMLAVLITGIVILVFLHNVRSTFIVLLAVPASLIITFLIMWMLGFSLNQLTLLAMTLVIGILVDDSIVVIENIERHLEMGKKPMQAALDGRREIGLAAITITLVDVVVYLPVAFMSGIVGQFFYSYGVTIAAAALTSLFIAFTLTPMLAGYWLKDPTQTDDNPTGLRKIFGIIGRPFGWIWAWTIRIFEGAFTALAKLYEYTVRFFLWNWATQIFAVLIAVAALAGGIFMVAQGYVQSEFFPVEDDGQVRITIEMPAGTNLDATDRVARQVEGIILSEVPELSAIQTQIGTGGGGGGPVGGGRSSNAATINLILVDKEDRERSTTDVVEALRPAFARIPDATIATALNSGGGGGGSPIQVRVFGPDQNTLIDLADQIETIILNTPGTADVKNTDAQRARETKLVVNRMQALDLGLSPVEVATTLRTALSGSQVGKFNPGGGSNDLDITLRLNPEARNDINQLVQMPVKYVNGAPLTLERVVERETAEAPAKITRADRQRVLTIGSGVAAGRGAGDVTNEIEAAINQNVTFPPGYGFKFVGTSEVQRESFAQLGNAILLAIALVYILLVALYQSWLQPLAIMFSLPVTLVGAIGGLYLTGNTLNLISLLGIVLLTGVVTKNAILVVDFTNQLREEEGLARKEALAQAGRMRLRAVLMTTLTLVFALLPLLLGSGAGSENRAPLAAVVIGGSISSTLLTLILVPVVYNFFDSLGGGTTRFFRWLFGIKKAEHELPRQPWEKPWQDKPSAAPQTGSAVSFTEPGPEGAGAGN
ncbi:MAG: efflux RND transporter permease subunit [Chloroflexi bacterium]|nr:MAG: efflux RND transporter permease subunit [Chloroflexota bacterium]